MSPFPAPFDHATAKGFAGRTTPRSPVPSAMLSIAEVRVLVFPSQPFNPCASAQIYLTLHENQGMKAEPTAIAEPKSKGR